MPFPGFETLKTVKNRNATFFGSEMVNCYTEVHDIRIFNSLSPRYPRMLRLLKSPKKYQHRDTQRSTV
jgi:hypothetical protein